MQAKGSQMTSRLISRKLSRVEIANRKAPARCNTDSGSKSCSPEPFRRRFEKGCDGFSEERQLEGVSHIMLHSNVCVNRF